MTWSSHSHTPTYEMCIICIYVHVIYIYIYIYIYIDVCNVHAQAKGETYAPRRRSCLCCHQPSQSQEASASFPAHACAASTCAQAPCREAERALVVPVNALRCVSASTPRRLLGSKYQQQKCWHTCPARAKPEMRVDASVCVCMHACAFECCACKGKCTLHG